MKKHLLLTGLLFLNICCFAQWGPVNTGLANLTSGAKLLGTSNTHIFSGTLGGAKMYHSNTNGNSWIEITPPVAGNVPECGFYENGKYFSGLNSSQDCIFYTTNNGASWNAVSGGPQTTAVRGFTSLSGIIYAYTSNKGVYRTTDGGLNWSTANTGLTNLNVAWMETINNKVFVATIGGGVFVSTNNGVSWSASNTGIAGGALNASYIWRMGTSLYYYEQGGSFYTSSNEGANWSVWAKPALMGLGIMEVYRNGSNLYLETRHFSGGLRDSIYLTTNEGANWTNITGNLSASNLNASGITEIGGFVFTAYNIISPGLGIYRRTTSLSTHEIELSDFITTYPNPFTDKISVSNYSNRAIKEILIYDNQNKLVMMTSSIDDSINTSELKNGFYTMKIVFKDNIQLCKKLIK